MQSVRMVQGKGEVIEMGDHHKNSLCVRGDRVYDMDGIISIHMKTLLTPEAHEKLEDALAGFLYSQGIEAVIENSVTGNSTTTKE